MMMEFAMEPALEKELADKKADKGTRWIRILIKDEKLVHDGSGKATDDGAEDLKKLQAEASENEPFYGLINATDDNEWVVLAYIPDTSKVFLKQKHYTQNLSNPTGRFSTKVEIAQTVATQPGGHSNNLSIKTHITTQVKQRMQYSSSLPSLKNRLGAMCIGDVRITEKDEVCLGNFLQQKPKEQNTPKKKNPPLLSDGPRATNSHQ